MSDTPSGNKVRCNPAIPYPAALGSGPTRRALLKPGRVQGGVARARLLPLPLLRLALTGWARGGTRAQPPLTPPGLSCADGGGGKLGDGWEGCTVRCAPTTKTTQVHPPPVAADCRGAAELGEGCRCTEASTGRGRKA